MVRLSDQVTVAYWARSLGARLSELCPEATFLFRRTTQFRSSKLSSEAKIVQKLKFSSEAKNSSEAQI